MVVVVVAVTENHVLQSIGWKDCVCDGICETVAVTCRAPCMVVVMMSFGTECHVLMALTSHISERLWKVADAVCR